MTRMMMAVLFFLAMGRIAMAETGSFDGDVAGSPPKGWTITMTGTGNPKWTVEKDDPASSKSNVLKQSGTATYPLALKNSTTIKDGFVEVKFKAVSGSEDRAAASSGATTMSCEPTPLKTTWFSTRQSTVLAARSISSGARAVMALKFQCQQTNGTRCASNSPGRSSP